MDDIGLRLAQQDNGGMQSLGRGLVTAMPKVLTTISVVGTVAMLWVGGHILMVNLGADGTSWFNAPYEWVHHSNRSDSVRRNHGDCACHCLPSGILVTAGEPSSGGVFHHYFGVWRGG
nr:DUF808 family protein [Halomonas sp. IOP_14]